jgi:two-component sensor histidine kinase
VLVRRSRRTGLLTAAAAVALGILIRVAFPFPGYPYVTFVPAVLVTAIAGGWLPATLAAVASIAYVTTLMTPTRYMLVPVVSPLGGVIAVSVIFAAQIGAIELIRIAAARSDAARRRAADLLAERDVMFRELQHRVANNMQFISTLLLLQARQLPAGDAGGAALNDAAGRLQRFATIHRRLHDTTQAERRFDAVALDILTDLLDATGCANVKLEVQADPAPLPLETLTTLILITTEAATNAIKHVFAESRGNRLSVRLARAAEAEYELTIADNGPGFPEGAPAEDSKSLGVRIMRSLIRQLRGTLLTQSMDGAVVRVVFPAPASGGDVPA